MISKLKKIIIQASALSLLLVPALAVGSASAQDTVIERGVCQGTNLQFSANPPACEDVQGSEEKVNNLITQVINVFSIIVGIVAVIMMIYGGFRYITSGGDSGNVTTAKNTILYALIGLIIVALAQFVVKFILAKTTQVAE